VNAEAKQLRLQRAAFRGLTLVEVLISVSILLVLFGVVIVSGKMARDSTKRSASQRQIAQLAAAVNQYAAHWPAWKFGNVVVADKGWPDFVPSQVFGAPYGVLVGFSDYTNLSGPPPATWLSSGSAPNNYELNANECLFYSLTTPVGGGPYLSPGAGAGDYRLAQAQNGSTLYYPALLASGAAPRQTIIDSWGTPIRYFWVYRSAATSSNTMAYRGYLPVSTADTASPDFQTAVGFVLESAGPDKKFGNIWKLVPDPLPANYETTDVDIRDAYDNLTVSP